MQSRRLFSVLGISLLIMISLIPFFNSTSRPITIGLTEGKLSDCPKSPNCVSTQTDQEEKQMNPLSYEGSEEAAMQHLREILESMPRTRIVTQTTNYLHAEVRSLLMRYVDDIEFSFDPIKKQIHFRSASRVGYSDLGVNRNRMEEIAQLFQKKSNS